MYTYGMFTLVLCIRMHRYYYLSTLTIMVTESPFNKTRPTRVLCFVPLAYFTSSQSSKTRFMYSSKPTICPSNTSPFAACSYSQIWTLLFVWRKRKMRLIGCVIMRWTFVAMMTLYVCIYAFTLLNVIRSLRLISPRWDDNNALFPNDY